MTTSAMNNLWGYIQGLNLSSRNRRWLIERMCEEEMTKPYTREELCQRVAAAQRRIDAGLYVAEEEVFSEYKDVLTGQSV